MFVDRIWPKLAASHRNEARHLSPSALFQVRSPVVFRGCHAVLGLRSIADTAVSCYVGTGEIHSYIKGSNAALETPTGKLSREEYLKLGAKMAPNFKGLGSNERMEELPGDRTGHRDLVYKLFEAYEEERKALGAYDISGAVRYALTLLWS
eukprot:3212113-Rhodomonas_salina.1